MKKFSRYIILIAALLLFAGLAPRFLLLDITKDTIAEQLGNRLGAPITMGQMRWAWLPFPHLAITDTGITHEYYEFSAPGIKIYPNWRAVFDRKLIFGRIHLQNPEIFITEKAFRHETTPEASLPELNVHINNGVLKIAPGEEYGHIIPPAAQMFSKIDGALKMGPQKAEFNFKAATPLSRSMALRGDFSLTSRHYQLSVDLQDIRLHETVKTLFNGRVIPVRSNARLAGIITGTGLQHIEGNLHGTLPSFKVSHNGREILLVPGFTDFSLLKSGRLYRLTINKLAMEEPQAKLSGLIERKEAAENPGMEFAAADTAPTWTLDLAGNDLDLTAIRRKVLTLWSDNHIAETVCGAVLSGKATSAAYRFSGKTADFHRLDAMVIEADVRDAAIHVPYAELDLAEANGPILIKDAILSGNGLGARLGKSYGRNGELRLGLAGENKPFGLDIDIDADLIDLPPVLQRLVAHDGFQRELARFRDVKGRAAGNLHLGDMLKNITTRVRVDSMRFQADYTPIPRTVHIERGALLIGRKSVNWQDVKGRIGQQEITATSGSVTWGSDEPLLQIEKIQGQVNGNALYALLEETGKLPEGKVRQRLSSLHGIIDVSRGTVAGPAAKPGNWQYQLEVKSRGLLFTTPLLPAPVTVNELAASLRNDAISIRQAAVRLFDEPLIISGNFQHRQLENWQGEVQFNGPLRGRLAAWLTDKGWFGKLQPRTPCTVENLTLGFHDKNFTLTGIIRHGADGDILPMVKINLENRPEHLRISELTFIAPGEQGNLTLEIKRSPARSVALSWQGFVNADTIAALFQQSPFIDGTFGGAFFQAGFSYGHPEATSFKGLFRAENLLLKGKDRSEDHTVFKNILLSGVNDNLRVASLNLAVGSEQIAGQGNIVAGPQGLQVNLDLTSSYVSEKALENLIIDLEETKQIFLGDDTAHGESGTAVKNIDITGRIGFDFDSYSVRREITPLHNDGEPFEYTLYDMHGALQLGTDSLSRTEIFSAKLCNLNFTADWYSEKNMNRSFELGSDAGDWQRMEKVLPCLGLKQDLFEGEFLLKANVRKESGVWSGGNIHIRSDRGRILRLKLLSRIFKVVNVTDLFVTQTGTTGKKGFPYTRMDIDAHIDGEEVVFDRAILYGEGLNLFLQGSVNLNDYHTDLTLLIAPFKTVDTLVSKVPLIGEPIMSGYESLVTFPVAIGGPLSDPLVTPLHPKAVGDALFNFVKETFKLPYNILRPPDIIPDDLRNPGGLK